ncbi:DUF3106 domain-containing protein [Marilutibacter aestuarii]|uniref:DUF3106 domain-containing protein n=1 Tax=Marilutibacter aestuarii TaxID=1706195 RepID=A0A508A475_9GAMM|nr:DUF3106 domain-containing protein [Lysobacter aestuarii]TQD41735.1 DUF3106 domain-containing protein [Lysobacter aestuarii]
MHPHTEATPLRRRALPRLLAVLLALALSPMVVGAPPPPQGPPPPGWDDLTDAQRDMLVAPIRERWNNEPDERHRMLERARRWQELSPEQRARARHGRHRWEDMSPEQRRQTRALFETMRSMTPEERGALKAKWRAMSPEQRDAWIQAQRAKGAD